jgi:hypothetical protein
MQEFSAEIFSRVSSKSDYPAEAIAMAERQLRFQAEVALRGAAWGFREILSRVRPPMGEGRPPNLAHLKAAGQIMRAYHAELQPPVTAF